ncbi:FAD-dependent thymidylate synthase [Congzhengia minquanensis]|uniref:Flavin-dependent thymidylate synthase n=1 Tax=Congzhengia minquanensis TaxID=2763657 RepID=A0A926DKM5_9FIRM|nr:FAD-dependent thymidylate synthase [Congzhengia minquanensis]MBC8540670.1 FAD-dependent thymidylate synthase [Congzhengia minquanensis]
MRVTLLQHTGEPEKIVAAAAKLCYSDSGVDNILDGLTDEKTDKFLNMLMNLGHESPIEHVSFTFGIEGVSRSLLAQITRHRLASYSVKSQRYVKEGMFEYIIPPEIEAIPEAKKVFLETMEQEQAAYDKLTEILFQKHFKALREQGMDEKQAKTKAEKAAIEDARFVLPNACETKMVVTMNARSLMNFFRHRCCSRAQWEIRALANEMLKLVQEVAPTLFKKAGPSCVSGPCPEGKMSCGKVELMRKTYLSEAK